MTQSKIEVSDHRPAPGEPASIARDEIRTDGLEDYADQLEDALDDESDFDVDEDIAFLGEDYDVLELDDVLELCNVDRRSSFRN
ncbi:MAG: hypothetical protein AAF942_08500 [Pseudomonadota bacterium]